MQIEPGDSCLIEGNPLWTMKTEICKTTIWGAKKI